MNDTPAKIKKSIKDETVTDGWVKFHTARRLTGLTRRELEGVIESGEVSVQRLPGNSIRVNVDEIQSLIRKSRARPPVPPPGQP